MKSDTGVKSYLHAGDLGDIVYSLPTIRYFSGGVLFLQDAPFTHSRMTPDRIRIIQRLLLAQPYIHDVRPWAGELVDHNLNDFREQFFSALKSRKLDVQRNLADWHLITHRVPTRERNDKWIEAQPRRVAKVVVSRTPRYQNPHFPWDVIWERYSNDAVFLGLSDEAKAFRRATGRDFAFYPTADLMEAAEVIAGADLFVGNQSVLYAVAEGLKKPAILEVCRWLPDCLFERPQCWHVWNRNSELPEL